ncbi:hypothetical protein ACLB2K_001389 [Fragaria x ananassa]
MVRVGSSRVIRPPVELLGKERVLEDAATTLFSLSKFQQLTRGTRLLLPWLRFASHEGRIAILEEGGISGLVEVTVVSERGKENAGAALLQLCTDGEKQCSMVLHEGLWWYCHNLAPQKGQKRVLECGKLQNGFA